MIIPKRMYKKMTEPVKDTAQKPVEQSGEVAGFLADLRDFVDGSNGIDGWHLNGDIATWGEIDITVDRIDQLLSRQQGPQGVEEFEDMIAQFGYKKENYTALINRIKQLLQQQPIRQIVANQKQVVTRGEFEVFYARMRDPKPNRNLLDYCVEWLKELGIEVEG